MPCETIIQQDSPALLRKTAAFFALALCLWAEAVFCQEEIGEILESTPRGLRIIVVADTPDDAKSNLELMLRKTGLASLEVSSISSSLPWETLPNRGYSGGQTQIPGRPDTCIAVANPSTKLGKDPLNSTALAVLMASTSPEEFIYFSNLGRRFVYEHEKAHCRKGRKHPSSAASMDLAGIWEEESVANVIAAQSLLSGVQPSDQPLITVFLKTLATAMDANLMHGDFEHWSGNLLRQVANGEIVSLPKFEEEALENLNRARALARKANWKNNPEQAAASWASTIGPLDTNRAPSSNEMIAAFEMLIAAPGKRYECRNWGVFDCEK